MTTRTPLDRLAPLSTTSPVDASAMLRILPGRLRDGRPGGPAFG